MSSVSAGLASFKSAVEKVSGISSGTDNPTEKAAATTAINRVVIPRPPEMSGIKLLKETPAGLAHDPEAALRDAAKRVHVGIDAERAAASAALDKEVHMEEDA